MQKKNLKILIRFEKFNSFLKTKRGFGYGTERLKAITQSMRI
jgi:hypothetical protein